MTGTMFVGFPCHSDIVGPPVNHIWWAYLSTSGPTCQLDTVDLPVNYIWWATLPTRYGGPTCQFNQIWWAYLSEIWWDYLSTEPDLTADDRVSGQQNDH